MKYRILLIVLAVAVVKPVSGQVKYSNEFLSIGAGARLMGMGGAGIALVDDASSVYWNPSRMTSIPGRLDATLMHSEYFAGLAGYDFGAAAWSAGEMGTFGLGLVRFAVDDIPNTLELIDEEGNVRYDRITTFSSADLAILATYARKMKIPGLSVGATVKLIYRHTGDFARAWGFGMDASASYRLKDWNFAAVLRDVTGTFNAWSFNRDLLEQAFELTGNTIPENSLEITLPRLIIASSRSFRLNEKLQLAPAVDLHFTFDGRRHVLIPLGPVGVDPFAGAELTFNSWLYARVGAGGFQWIPGLNGKSSLSLRPSLGIGIQYRGIFIDYALNGFSDVAATGYSNLVSLRLSLK